MIPAWFVNYKKSFNVFLKIVVFLLEAVYSILLRPNLQGKCRFYPSCSVYAKEVFFSHNTCTACYFILKRLVRCHPFGECGEDLAPQSTSKPIFQLFFQSLTKTFKKLWTIKKIF